MVMICQLSNYTHCYVEGLYRLTKIRRSTKHNKHSNMVALLEDCSGQIYCHDWRFDSLSSYKISSNLYSCMLYIEKKQDTVIAKLISVEPATPPLNNPLQFLPYSALATPKSVIKLQDMLKQCPITTLRQFVNCVFANDEYALPFFQLPASREHHHAYPGGLAEHSLEVMTIVQHSLWQASEDEYWLSSVAALFHDIGKLKVFKQGGNKTPTGFVLDHDVLTLELLAEPLRDLDKVWPDGAIALRYLLTKSTTITRPLMPCALAIDYADKMSSAQATRKQAFKKKPAWQRFAKLDAKGPASLFWQPKLSNTQQKGL